MEAFTGINRKIESLWGWRNSFPFLNLDCFIYGKLLYYKQEAKKVTISKKGVITC